MKGNPFFTQERPGYKEKIFKLIKFRTMTNERDENGELLPDEIRLNKYGRFLRSTSLDELPEAINIFIGDMSVVGPRPLLVRYLPLYNELQVRISVPVTAHAKCLFTREDLKNRRRLLMEMLKKWLKELKNV